MKTKQTTSSDQITVIIFKDHLASRSFRFPMKWISRLGLIIGFITFSSVLGIALAVKYYRLAASSHPANLHELELELNDLKAQLSQTAPHTNTASIQNTHNTQAQPQIDPQATEPQPTTTTGIREGHPLYSLFPSNTQLSKTQQNEFPLQVQSPRFKWINQSLSVEFALENKKSSSGSQQGRIILLAHGKNFFISYPEGTLQHLSQNHSPSSLLHPEQGESYSVSRYRLVSAHFSPVGSKKMRQSLEIFLFNREGTELLFHHTYPITDQEPQAPTHSAEDTQP